MPRKPATTVREVIDARDPAVRRAYALLSRSFERKDRVPLRDWLGTLKESSSRVLTDIAWHLIVAERRGRVIGFTSGTYLGNVNLGVIGYLAIAPGLRALGTGTRLRTRLRRAFERDARRIAKRPLEAIVGEVSAGNPWIRTLAKRPNVLVLDFPYYQPRLSAGDEPSPFLLYYESMQGPRQRLPARDLRRILYTIWRRIYRVSRPLDRRAFRAMLRALEGRRTVGRRKLS